jgi:hypothetical protein
LGVKIGRIFVGFWHCGKLAAPFAVLFGEGVSRVALWYPTLRKEREGWSGSRGKNRCFYPR